MTPDKPIVSDTVELPVGAPSLEFCVQEIIEKSEMMMQGQGPYIQHILKTAKHAKRHLDASHRASPTYGEPVETRKMLAALADLADAFLSKHGCFPLDETTDDERHWRRAMARAYDFVGAPTSPLRDSIRFASHPVSDEAIERGAYAIFATWAMAEGSDMTWADAITAAENPEEFPRMAKIVPLCRAEAAAVISAISPSPVKQPVGEVTRESVIEECAQIADAVADEKDVMAMGADESNFAAYREGERTAKEIATCLRALASNPPEAPTVEADKQKVKEGEWIELSSESYPVAETVVVSYFDQDVGEWVLAIKDAPIETWPWTHFLRTGRPTAGERG